MKRPVSEADVDAVIARREGVDLASIHPGSLYLLRQRAERTLNAAVALGWTPPGRPGDAHVAIDIAGLPAGEWRDHPLIVAIGDHASDEAGKYPDLKVVVTGGRAPEEATPDAR